MRFAYPKQTEFGRVVPKTKIYQAAKANTRTQDLFVDQIKRLVWQNKLASETLNLPASAAVPEVQVFRVELHGKAVSEQVLATIDRAIPLPLIFEIVQVPDPNPDVGGGGRVASVAAHKRPSEADGAKWVTSSYRWGPWVAGDIPRLPLPQALDLETLYARLLEPLVAASLGDDQPASTAPSNSDTPPVPIAEQIAAAEAVERQQKLVARLAAKVRNTKQFNKQVAANAELRQALNELEALKQAAKIG